MTALRWPCRSMWRLLDDAIESLEKRRPKPPRAGFRLSWDEDAYDNRLDEFEEAMAMLREASSRLEDV